MKERDYSFLEGKIVELKEPYKEITHLKVLGCELDIGITLANADNLDQLVVCTKNMSRSNPSREYKAIFFSIVRMLKLGTFDAQPMYNILNLNPLASVMEHTVDVVPHDFCPFNQ